MKKILSIWLSIILVMGILFSYDYLSENTHHDCQEKECHVCVGLVTALKFVSGLKALSGSSSYGKHRQKIIFCKAQGCKKHPDHTKGRTSELKP